MATKFLEEAEVVRIHYALVDMFSTGEDPIIPPGPRDNNLVASACSRPQTALGRTEKYTSVFSKAAALFHSLVMNHPFHNGNKRTALVATLTFLELNGHRLRSEVADEEIFDFVTSVAAGRFPKPGFMLDHDALVLEISTWIRDRTVARRRQGGDMPVSEFLEACRQAGARVRETENAWLVQGFATESRRISKSTRKLDAGAVRNYVSALGLAGSTSGLYIDEFQDGANPEQQLMTRFRVVLNRLANA